MATNNKPTTKVVTGLVRFNCVEVYKPESAGENDSPNYGIEIIILKKDAETLNLIKAAVKAAKKAGRASKWGGIIPAKLQTPLRDGDKEHPGDPLYANAYFLRSASNQKPGIVDISLKPITDETEVYNGCYGRIAINFYPYDKDGEKGVAAGLDNIQKLKDGEHLGGRVAA